jgi:hypothetical protein
VIGSKRPQLGRANQGCFPPRFPPPGSSTPEIPAGARPPTKPPAQVLGPDEKRPGHRLTPSQVLEVRAATSIAGLARHYGISVRLARAWLASGRYSLESLAEVFGVRPRAIRNCQRFLTYTGRPRRKRKRAPRRKRARWTR